MMGRMIRPSRLLGCLLLTTSLAFAQATQPVVHELLQQLSSDDIKARDAAQAALLQQADESIEAIKIARSKATDPDLQLRLDTLLVQAQERIDIGPSRISLHFNDTRLDEVLVALAEQSRANFANVGPELGGDEQIPRVTVNVDNVSFWKALDAIENAAGNITFNPQVDGWHVNRVFNQGGGPDVSAECGAFLVKPQNATYQRSSSYVRNGGGGSETFTLSFLMIAEPKVRLSVVAPATMQLDRAVDSNGNDLIGVQQVQQIGVNANNMLYANLMLKYPKNAGEKIAEISGTMRVNMARHVETLESDDLVRDGKVQREIDGTTITIEVIPTPANQRNQVSLKVTADRREDDPNQLYASRIQQSLQQIRLTDSRGTTMRISSSPNIVSSTPRRSEIQMSLISLQPQSSTGPYKLRFDIPTSFREVEVPFSFGNLKMP